MGRFLFFILCVLCSQTALAQSLNIDLGAEGGEATSRIIQLIAIVTVISLAPSILVMVTSFTRIVIVFSFVRTAMGLQQTPPNSVLISLALFLTLFIMHPVFTESYEKGIQPLIEEQISEEEAIEPIISPFRNFMLSHVRDQDLGFFLEASHTETLEKPEDTPLKALVPAFMLSEIRRAFEIGFLIFIPFLVIDMLVAATLMSMGMMMLPPVIISLPFKLIFFVLIDGWYLLVGSLVRSFGV